MIYEPTVYPTVKEALEAPDWRLLNYVEQYDDGWVAVYMNDMWMDSKSGKMYPRSKFRHSNNDQHPSCYQLMSKPMYPWKDCVPEDELKDRDINQDYFLEITSHCERHLFRASDIRYIGYEDINEHPNTLTTLAIDTGTLHKFVVTREEALEIMAKHSSLIGDIL
jgi:hypothetical protein